MGRLRGHGECLRRSRGEAAGEKLGAHPTKRCVGNMRTIPVLPTAATNQVVAGQVHRRLIAPGWGGGSVVVRGRESRPHGEGTQRVGNDAMAMAGVRR